MTCSRNFTGKSSAAEIVTDKSENFIYSSNRGADTIAIFKTIEVNLNSFADFCEQNAIRSHELMNGNFAFGLVADVDDNGVIGDAYNLPCYD